MYIHPCGNYAVSDKDIIGIFDMDNTTVSRASRGFLSRVQATGGVVSANDDLPRSYVVAVRGGDECVYLSPLSCSAIVKNIKLSPDEEI